MDYDRIIKEAVARRDGLLSELKELEALIKAAEVLALREELWPSRPKPKAQAEPVSKRRRSPLGNPTRAAVTAILRERGGPMPTRDLVPLVRQRAVEIGGKDPIATLSARLSNAAEFKLHRGFGWWFANEPLPGHATIFEEAGAQSPAGPAPASNASQGDGHEAAALASDPDRQ